MTIQTIPLLINGEEVTTGTTFDVVNPSTGETVFTAYGASAADAKAAVDAAAKAFPSWSKTKPNERRALFLKAAQLMRERVAEVTQLQVDETSVDKGFAGGFQGGVSVGMLEECGARTSSIEGAVPETDEAGTPLKPFGLHAFTVRC
jgi:acyl-CoA reductase-like NAD-dependent aldehyde dehydrogenase